MIRKFFENFLVFAFQEINFKITYFEKFKYYYRDIFKMKFKKVINVAISLMKKRG